MTNCSAPFACDAASTGAVVATAGEAAAAVVPGEAAAAVVPGEAAAAGVTSGGAVDHACAVPARHEQATKLNTWRNARTASSPPPTSVGIQSRMSTKPSMASNRF